MIVKVRTESNWTYISDVRRVKTEEGIKDGKTMIDKLLVYRNLYEPLEVVEVHGNPVYLLNDEGKTIERIN